MFLELYREFRQIYGIRVAKDALLTLTYWNDRVLSADGVSDTMLFKVMFSINIFICSFFLVGKVSAGSSDRDGGAFRCGSKIIREGMMRSQVMEICGEPTDIAHRNIVRYKNISQSSYSLGSSQSRHIVGSTNQNNLNEKQNKSIDFNDPIAVEKGIEDGILEYDDAEDWYYNFGSNRMTRNLTFINNRLESISVGERGH